MNPGTTLLKAAVLASAMLAAQSGDVQAQTKCTTVSYLVTRTVHHPDGSYTVTRQLYIETICTPI